MFTLSPTTTWRREKTECFIVNHTLSSHFQWWCEKFASPCDTEYFCKKFAPIAYKKCFKLKTILLWNVEIKATFSSPNAMSKVLKGSGVWWNEIVNIIRNDFFFENSFHKITSKLNAEKKRFSEFFSIETKQKHRKTFKSFTFSMKIPQGEIHSKVN